MFETIGVIVVPLVLGLMVLTISLVLREKFFLP